VQREYAREGSSDTRSAGVSYLHGERAGAGRRKPASSERGSAGAEESKRRGTRGDKSRSARDGRAGGLWGGSYGPHGPLGVGLGLFWASLSVIQIGLRRRLGPNVLKKTLTGQLYFFFCEGNCKYSALTLTLLGGISRFIFRKKISNTKLIPATTILSFRQTWRCNLNSSTVSVKRVESSPEQPKLIEKAITSARKSQENSSGVTKGVYERQQQKATQQGYFTGRICTDERRAVAS
jgi:hypothetical protein